MGAGCSSAQEVVRRKGEPSSGIRLYVIFELRHTFSSRPTWGCDYTPFYILSTHARYTLSWDLRSYSSYLVLDYRARFTKSENDSDDMENENWNATMTEEIGRMIVVGSTDDSESNLPESQKCSDFLSEVAENLFLVSRLVRIILESRSREWFVVVLTFPTAAVCSHNRVYHCTWTRYSRYGCTSGCAARHTVTTTNLRTPIPRIERDSWNKFQLLWFDAVGKWTGTYRSAQPSLVHRLCWKQNLLFSMRANKIFSGTYRLSSLVQHSIFLCK